AALGPGRQGGAGAVGGGGVKKLAAVVVLAVSVAAPAAAEPLHIVGPGGPIDPGEWIQLRALPPSGDGEREGWLIVSGPGLLSSDGRFKAPYVAPAPGAVTVVRVTRGPKEAPITATAELRIREGSFPGAESCAGSNQGHIPEPGEYVPVDELPFAIHTVTAEYPPSARARRIQGGLVVNVLVCRSGNVIDAYAQWGVGATPNDALESAALDAARQYVFQAGTVAGQPVASWVAIPFNFNL